MKTIDLTPAQQDYLEAIFRLEAAGGDTAISAGVRITDIAGLLGTRLPTVVRNISRLKAMHLVRQRERGPVALTARGRELAAQLAHRHSDVMELLTEVLGVNAKDACAEACLLEHGISGATSQRLHQFLNRWQELDAATRDRLAGKQAPPEPSRFTMVGKPGGAGGRH